MAEPTILNLEEKCPHCEGEGRFHDQHQWVDCSYCEGAGYLPTELGQQILNLVSHNLGVLQGGNS